MPTFRLSSKSRARQPYSWWLLGLAAGSLASAGALLFYRARPRRHAAAPLNPETLPAPIASSPIPSSAAWMAGDAAPNAGTPSHPDPTEARDTADPAGGIETESWLGALELAMQKRPRDLGYDRFAWTAPMLAQYLLDTRGVSVPLPRLRSAIRELGYHWQHTRYVQAHPTA